jgi:DNA-binding NarL/FixJ family response regulator
MALTPAPPRPISPLSGRFAPTWDLLRGGRVRDALSDLTSPAGHELDDVEQVEQAYLLLTCRLALGDLPGASAAGGRLDPEASGPDAVLAHLGQGDLATALGDHDSALEHFRRASEQPDADDPRLTPWRAGAAFALARLSRRAEAVTLARDLLAVAERAADGWQTAIALRTLATVDTAADALTTLDRARGLARAVGDTRLAAQVDTDLAGLLLLAPGADRSTAVGLLRAAEAYAVGDALWPLHARAARLLERAGERARPLRSDAVALLTQAEHRVARLAARGLTNRQIAEQLSVTIKGIEWHLSRVYRKLGIRSRTALADLLDVTSAFSATA